MTDGERYRNKVIRQCCYVHLQIREWKNLTDKEAEKKKHKREIRIIALTKTRALGSRKYKGRKRAWKNLENLDDKITDEVNLYSEAMEPATDQVQEFREQRRTSKSVEYITNEIVSDADSHLSQQYDIGELPHQPGWTRSENMLIKYEVRDSDTSQIHYRHTVLLDSGHGLYENFDEEQPQNLPEKMENSEIASPIHDQYTVVLSGGRDFCGNFDKVQSQSNPAGLDNRRIAKTLREKVQDCRAPKAAIAIDDKRSRQTSTERSQEYRTPKKASVAQYKNEKIAKYMMTNNTSPTIVRRIGTTLSTRHLNNAKTSSTKQERSPLAGTRAKTIRKSHESTSHIVLSRVSDIGISNVTTANDDSIFNDRNQTTIPTRQFPQESRRHSDNQTQMMTDRQLVDLMNHRKGSSPHTSNTQSLQARSPDLMNVVSRNAKVLIFTDTSFGENKNVEIRNFTCIVKYKRADVCSGGVSMYRNDDDTSNIVTPHVKMTVRQSQSTSSTVSSVGEFSMAECKMKDGKMVVNVAIYIFPNQSIDDIIHFLQRPLLPYTHAGAALLGTGENELPMIVTGDFNIDFASESSLPLVEFFREKLNLIMTNDPLTATTSSGTTMDGVFSRNIRNMKSKLYIFNFPVITNR